ncbi:hypothetical protein [Streptomyces sp. S.PB5]|uniref:hypothetical protein n=1 Tax=Streptomyces sp. S.PB5 TaxID=3020844 RepID=UPI0025AF1B2B|nr:hypothetical protein [Streptomyces sp. S.PB5]MDN3026768.1 hypothetical protein [Streptomyces sp. S.PB5]
MTAYTDDKPVVRRAETGWARARRLRDKGVVRTWVPAVVESDSAAAAGPGPEANIVRGED